jgi:hypothetical protein
VKVEIHTSGTRGQMVLDGVDVSNGVHGFQLSYTAGGNLPLLTLDPLVMESEVSGDMKVYISPAASDLLCRLGWTPPAGAP